MKFSGISRAQLVRELEAERDVLTACAAKGLPIARAHFAGELRDVQAFLEYLTAAPENTPQSATARPRCAHYRAIRRAFAIARERGLNVKDESEMRRAFGRALGREVTTREELNGRDWSLCADMMKRGALAW